MLDGGLGRGKGGGVMLLLLPDAKHTCIQGYPIRMYVPAGRGIFVQNTMTS